MLFRLLFLIVIVGGAIAVWRSLQGDPRLDVPGEWTRAASAHPWLQEALELRQKIVERVVAGKASSASDLVADVDEVMARLVDISTVDGHMASASDELRGRLEASLIKLTAERASAISWLTEAYAVLIESAANEFDATVDELQGRLRTQKEQLRMEVEARREINQALRKIKA